METTFEEEIAIEHLARLNAGKWGRRLKEVRGEYIYTDFRLWLHCQGRIDLANNEKVNVTISVGVATVGEGGVSPQEIIEFSDKCLYKAKESGRNQVVSEID